MEHTLERLNQLISQGEIDLSDFYVVSLYEGELALQGHHTLDKMDKYSKFGKFNYLEDVKYFQLNTSDLDITLTLNK